METVFSVIKRKYGSFILSKTFETQKKELLLRLVAYNIDRKLIISIYFGGIHQSRFFQPAEFSGKIYKAIFAF